MVMKHASFALGKRQWITVCIFPYPTGNSAIRLATGCRGDLILQLSTVGWRERE